jgi:hypothetical protein
MPPSQLPRPHNCFHPTRSGIYLLAHVWWCFLCLHRVNCRVPIAVILIVDFCHRAEGCCGGAVICCHTEIWIFGFRRPVEGYCNGAVTYFSTGLLPFFALYSTKPRPWIASRCIYLRLGHQLLVVWSVNRPALWCVSNVSIIFDAPCLFLHHLLSVLLHFVALLCIFRN